MTMRAVKPGGKRAQQARWTSCRERLYSWPRDRGCGTKGVPHALDEAGLILAAARRFFTQVTVLEEDGHAVVGTDF